MSCLYIGVLVQYLGIYVSMVTDTPTVREWAAFMNTSYATTTNAYILQYRIYRTNNVVHITHKDVVLSMLCIV